ncbi:MAG TPA: fasciclin domain-containing protein [Nocardioides sp.]
MKTLARRSTMRRASGIAALALTMSVGLAACGDDADDDSNDGTSDPGSSETSDDAGMTEDPGMTESEGATDDTTFGAACDQIPASGAGSLDGMTVDPVATAAGNNPLLTQLVGAVGLVPGLADTLNSAEALTVFAPYDPAFEAVDPAALESLTADPEALGAVLGYHVLGERLEPDAIAGTYDSFAGPEITVTGDSSGMTVGAEGTEATVLCGGIQTANATVYVIDSVLMPAATTE